MNANQFRALVRSLEGFERKNPVLYRLAVALLAGLGYGYIFLIVALLLGVVGGMGYGVYYLVRYSGMAGVAMIGVVKIGIPVALALLAVAQALVRSLNVSIPAPDGPELTREAASRLFSMLDGICTTLRAPKIQRVLLDEDFNAGVLQVPKYGLLGFQTNYLILGLPLMQALSMEQFRAVLAHEIGHVSGNHSRFSGWIYRLRKTWFMVLEHLGHNIVFSGFFHWYAPYFWAVSFVLARSNEYVADRCSAEVVGKQVAAETLLSIAVKARYLDDKFWPEVYKAADVHDRPVGAPFTAMHQSLRTASAASDAEEWLEELLRQRSEIDDTHPALSDRLGSLGYPVAIGGPLDRVKCPVPLPPPSEENAASVLLERIAGPFAGKLDEEWRSGIARRWAEVHRDAQIARNRWAGLTRHRQEGGNRLPRAALGTCFADGALRRAVRRCSDSKDVAPSLAPSCPGELRAGTALARREQSGGNPVASECAPPRPEVFLCRGRSDRRLLEASDGSASSRRAFAVAAAPAASGTASGRADARLAAWLENRAQQAAPLPVMFDRCS